MNTTTYGDTTMIVPTALQPIAIQFRDPYHAAPYVLPASIESNRVFDDPSVGIEAHDRMRVRFTEEVTDPDMLEG